MITLEINRPDIHLGDTVHSLVSFYCVCIILQRTDNGEGKNEQKAVSFTRHRHNSSHYSSAR